MRRVDFGIDAPQRPITRVGAVIVGIYMILGPIAIPFTHANQRQEFAAASLALQLAIVAIAALAIGFGSIFLIVGFTGNLPFWLAKRINEHCR
jgi:hypothetical protein